MLPCAGQGALGLEIRADDAALADALAPLVHRPRCWPARPSGRCRAPGGSCSVPLAAHAQWAGERLQLRAALGHAAQAAAPLLRADVGAAVTDVAAARALGEQVAQALREQGAAAYLAG
jgi:hydroxymethylbilane synthase